MTSRIYIIAYALLSLIISSCGNAPKATSAEKPLTEQEKMLQEMAKSWKAPYEVQLDQTVFNKQQMNTYTSDKYEKAAIMIMVVPSTFAEEKAKFGKMQPKAGETVLSKNVETLNGRETLVYKAKREQEGVTLLFHAYSTKGDDNMSIFLTGACKPEDEATLAPLFAQAASNVKLKN
jgi:hypothetical protein